MSAGLTAILRLILHHALSEARVTLQVKYGILYLTECLSTLGKVGKVYCFVY
jgi:hypothetical protein